jgi:hypothetical protein
MANSRRVQKAILDVVDNQIRDLNPPATKQTFDRLVSEGIGEDEARRLIGCVVAGEIFNILKSEQPFDENRYITLLNQLPELPWED